MFCCQYQKHIIDFENKTHTITCMKNTLSILLKKKIKHYSSREWYVWATPTEILYIVDAWKLKAVHNNDVMWAREQHAKGDGTPRHFYFFMSEAEKERIRFTG